MFNWPHIEKAIKDKNQISGYLNHILSSIKIKSHEVRDSEIYLSLIVPNFIVKEVCEREIATEIAKHVKMEYSKSLIVEYVIENTQQSFALDDEVSPSEVIVPVQEAIQAPRFEFKPKYALNQRMTFDSLVLSEENKFAQKALQLFVEDQNSAMSCAGLFGNSGVGKTHLLHSVGWHFLNQNPLTKIKIVSGDEFINDFQTAIFAKTMGEFRNKYRLKTDVLLIDDLQTLEKAKGTQGELFNLLNEFSQTGRKIIITSDKKIAEFTSLDERLKSRFLGGLVLNLEHPSLQSKMNYLDARLKQHHLILDSEMKEAVLSNLGACYRSIEGSISRLEMLFKINGKLDRDSVLKMFPLLNKKISAQLSVDAVIQKIATQHGLIKADLVGPSRKREIFLARKEAIKQLREVLNMSLKEIGLVFNRDHTSIMNALK